MREGFGIQDSAFRIQGFTSAWTGVTTMLFNRNLKTVRTLFAFIAIAFALGEPAASARGADEAGQEHRFLYVAVPGIRDYLEFGGHGLLVFDIDAGHKCAPAPRRSASTSARLTG
jgi:hypothetical protein